MSTSHTLAEVRALARTNLQRDGGPLAAFADTEPTGVDELATWLTTCAAAVRAGDFLLPAMEEDTNTLYLWLNEVTANLDRWFLSAFGYAWPGGEPGEDSGAQVDDDPRTALAGWESGDVTGEGFALTGMEVLQDAMAQQANGDAVGAAGRFVVASAMALVDRALARTGDLAVRVALSRSEEPLVALWTADGTDRYDVEVHWDDTVWP